MATTPITHATPNSNKNNNYCHHYYYHYQCENIKDSEKTKKAVGE